jgi:Tol biopolymer transport system component
MALVPGARLGPYEIITLVGAGGMGEVYKAKDTRLERTVAIKILPSALAADPEFRERFDREARTISQLSHPHICTLYDVGHQDGSDFLVMEFLDGESLADRLARSKGGPLPLQEAMAIAIQVADALDAAHRAGVVHRDLKPGNIILTAAGAKLVDFGLAKHGLTLPQATGPTGRTSLTAPPTVTSPLTIIGSIVGTLQYMSPEQLDGKEADARSDVFAFGAVLYEMLSGRRAFQGKTQVSVMAAIIEQDPPPLGSVDASYSAALTRVVQKCLAKEPQQRWQTVADLVDELRWIAQDGRSRVVGPTVTPEAVVRSVRRHRIAVAVAVAAAVGAGAIGAWAVVRVRQQPVPQPVRFSIVPPPSQPLTAGSAIHDIAISADGSHIVYRAGPAFDQTQLVVRDLNQLDGRFVGERGLGVSAPFFSPDAQWIGYAAGFDLKKVPTAGGAAITLTRLSGGLRGATWGPDDTIVFATSDFSTGLLSVPAGGGEPKTLTKPETNGGDHYFPSFLPNGRAVLFTIATGSANSIGGSQVAVLDLKTGQQKMLIRGGSDATYVADASTGGYLVYIAAASTLHAVRFDPDRLELRGDPVPIVEQVLTSPTGGSDYAVARNGTLVFVPGGRTFFGGPALPRSLVWVTRQGREEGLNAPTRSYSVARLSPDGKRVALEIIDQETDIWTWDLTRRTLSRLTVDPAADLRPVWTPDGRRIIFTSARAGAQNLFWRASDGTGADERLTTSPNLQIPAAVTSDGTKLLVVEVIPGKAGDIVAVDLSPANATQPKGHRTSTSIITSSFVENNPELSPDNRWIAYQSNESGLNQVYVRPFPNTNEGLWQVSSGGGTRPLWSRSGRELFFLDGNNMLAAVPVETKGSTFSVGNAVKLLSTAYYAGIPQRTYDVTADGQRFLIIKDVPGDRTSTSPTINVVLNWQEELKQRVPTR